MDAKLHEPKIPGQERGLWGQKFCGTRAACSLTPTVTARAFDSVLVAEVAAENVDLVCAAGGHYSGPAKWKPERAWQIPTLESAVVKFASACEL